MTSAEEYRQVKSRANAADELYFEMVDDCPYYPHLMAQAHDMESIRRVTCTVLGLQSSGELPVTKVPGGLTNQLFRVQGLSSLSSSSSCGSSSSTNDKTNDKNKEKKKDDATTTTTNTTTVTKTTESLPVRDSVLIRIFGGGGDEEEEELMDRNVDTSHFAALCRADHILGSVSSVSTQSQWYGGRFGNGRIEGWLEGYRATNFPELSHYATEIAAQLARLHTLYRPRPPQEPEIWSQLDSWFQQARSRQLQRRRRRLEEEESTTRDCIQQADDDESSICPEFHLETLHTVDLPWLQSLVPATATVAYCHNDLLAANIMVSSGGTKNKEVQLIDLEYGGWNYVAYDIANHWNEYAGGTDATQENGVPNYQYFPTRKQQEAFLQTYVQTRSRLELLDDDDKKESTMENQVEELAHHVQSFLLVNHLYWGLWAWNQAAAKGCEEFHYFRYAQHRMKRYYQCKAQILPKEGQEEATLT